ncbi:MAG: 23S rRNA (pseudouridine(1915)-N(3))-methyltransferase RlmH [Pseudomonadota bacterium]
MLKLRVVAVGKIKSGSIRELVNDYAGRIAHYLPIECIAVKDEQSTLKALGPDDILIACDANGEQKTSEQFASLLEAYQKRNIKNLIFFIGGPEGIDSKLKQKADKLLALSKMTFPHELAQAILLEQIYRACTILRGEKYHK